MNNTALAVIQEHEKKQDLVFVRPEDLNTQKFFVPEVTVLHATPEDFHTISGQMMPKGYYTDRIGQAAGVSFVAENCGVKKDGENVYVGFAQGKRRLPDGTWRLSSIHEYELDVDSRAREDFLSKPDKYKTAIDKEKHTLEIKRFARQKAGTGAHLKVIRELVGIPISFKPAQIQKAIVVSRIAVNTDELLSTPGMQQAAIAQAVGTQQQLFGPGQGNVERKVIEADAGLEIPVDEVHLPVEEAPVPFEDDIPWEEKPEDIARRGLQHYLDNSEEVYKLPAEATETIVALLSVENATLQALQDCEKRIKQFIEKREQSNEKYAAHMQAMREAGRVLA